MEECGYVVDVGPIGFAEGMDARRETERQGDREKRKKKEGGGRRGRAWREVREEGEKGERSLRLLALLVPWCPFPELGRAGHRE